MRSTQPQTAETCTVTENRFAEALCSGLSRLTVINKLCVFFLVKVIIIIVDGLMKLAVSDSEGQSSTPAQSGGNILKSRCSDVKATHDQPSAAVWLMVDGSIPASCEATGASLLLNLIPALLSQSRSGVGP